MRISEHRFTRHCARCADFSVEHQGIFYSFGSLLKGAEGHPTCTCMTWLNIFSPHLQENE